ncbi:MAG: GNAT family N-acetyltransferase [bacterium]|nr:GNAT family N-acetyltransferase [bacterium]
MRTRNFIRALEEISNNALPSLYTLHYDGWVLRFSDSRARRANSVSPLYPSALDTDEKIAYCEALFERRDRPVVFKLTDAALPDDLTAALHARGYAENSRTSVQTLSIDESDAWIAFKDDRYKVTFTNRVTQAWLDDQHRFHDADERARLTTRSMYDLLIPHAAFFRLAFDGVAVAAGLGVIERGWMGLYGIVVDAPMRGRGIGEELVRRMLAYGAAFNAANAYLQVMTANQAALRLYARLGFEQSYQYWYLQKS